VKPHPLFALGAILMAGVAVGANTAPQALLPCPSDYHYNDSVDYHDPAAQVRIHGIEGNHLNADVENLVRGQSTSSASGDLRFILGYVPNHRRAMAALMRMALRDRTDRLPELGEFTVRCWLHRGTVYSPKDAEARMLYGIYLARNNMNKEAIEELEEASALLPNNSELSYNLGLLFFNQKDYKTSATHAKRAYELGYPLPGLRQKLTSVGVALD